MCVKSMLAQHFIGQWPTLAKQLNSLPSGGGHTGRMSVLCNLFIPAKQCTLISSLITYCISFECLTKRKKKVQTEQERERESGKIVTYT